VKRLVATDLDGTLVRGDRSISPRTAKAFGRLASAGVPIVLVTGRPIRWLPGIYEQLTVRPLAVCVNGAAIYDPETDEMIHSAPLTAEAVAEACTRLRAAVPGVVFAAERDGGRNLVHETDYAIGPWEVGRDGVRSAPYDEVIAAPAHKLLVRAGAQPPDEFTALVAECVAGVAEATNSSSSGMVEVSAAGVTKASGLARVADSLGIAAGDVVAFGDMPNDLPMLAWVGHGVAMLNGHPAVRAAAHAVTTYTNEDDGVAAYLETLFALD
jgi:hypothetical protein